MRNIPPPRGTYWKPRYAELLEMQRETEYKSTMAKRSMLGDVLAYLAERRWNRLEAVAISGASVAAADKHWLAAAVIVVGGAILSAALEAANPVPISKEEGW